MRSYFFAASAAVILTVAGSQRAGAQDTTSPVRLTGKDVIRAPEDPRFTERDRVLVKGYRNERGVCVFDRRTHVTKGERFTEKVIERDPTTCMFVVARGQQTSADAVTDRTHSSKSTRLGR